MHASSSLLGRAATLSASLAAAMSLAAAWPALAGAQGEPVHRVRIVRPDTVGDSTFMRVTISMDRIEGMIRELMASRAMEHTIGQSLREAASGQAGDSRRIRELSDELARVAQKNAALITRIEMSCASGRQPEGYIGVQINELQESFGDPSPLAAPLHDFPRIDSVYAGSPASKAGLRRGDVVLLIAGQDARRPVQLERLLKPTVRLPMRVQRDGTPKDVTLVVEKRPVDFNADCANADQVLGPEFEPPFAVMRSNGVVRTPAAPPAPGNPAIVYFPDVPASATPSFPPMPAAPPAPNFFFGYTTAGSPIAGASLMGLDDDWRATLGVDNGVLVTKVLPGTPSKDSGLRSGDVITTADGQAVGSVRTFSRIVSNAKGNTVKLQVIRAGKPVSIALRWQDAPPDD